MTPFRFVTQMLAAAGLTLLVSGCIGGVGGLADLSVAAKRVAPVSQGQYVSLTDDDGAVVTMFVPTGEYNEFYLWDPSGGAQLDLPSSNLRVTFFEPVEGIYIAQTRSLSDEDPIQFAYFLARFEGNRIKLSTDDLPRLVGEEIFAVFGGTRPDDADVQVLTDNAFLNWAILQRVVLNRAAEIEYEDFVLRLADPNDEEETEGS